MENLDRRAFLGTALATLPLAMLAQTGEAKVKPVRVPSGEDRLGERHVIGVSSTAFKVLTDDSASALFVIEHASRKKGGPPRHLHHNENEWFYVLEGEYIAEIGSERFQLKPGDSILNKINRHHTMPSALKGNKAQAEKTIHRLSTISNAHRTPVRSRAICACV